MQPRRPIQDKNSSLSVMTAAAALPRFLTSATSRVARSKYSPLSNYYTAMHQKGFNHGLHNSGQILPRARRPLLANLGTMTGFADYEMGMQNGLQIAKQLKAKNIPTSLLEEGSKQYQNHMANIAKINPESPILRYAVNATQGPKSSRMADWLERRFMSDKSPDMQGRITSGLGALRTGVAEAALSPHEPLTGFLKGMTLGSLESFPEALGISALSRGYADPIIRSKGTLMNYGVNATRGKPDRMRIMLQNLLGTFDSNANEAMAAGRDLGRFANQQGIVGDLSDKAIGALQEHTQHARPFQQLLEYSRRWARSPRWLPRFMRRNPAVTPVE